MSAYRDEFANASKTAQRKITEETAFQFQNEFAKTFEEMSRAVILRVGAEIELGVKLTERLGAARSLPDIASAYHEWLSDEMNARSEDARQFMINSQMFISERVACYAITQR